MAVVRFFSEGHLAWIPLLIGVLFLISFGGVFLIFSLCVSRRIQDKNVQAVVVKYREKFIDIVCSDDPALAAAIQPNSWERPFVRNLLLSTILSVQGDGQKRLMKLYVSLRYLREDYVSLISTSFSDRLGALARMETVRDIVTTPIIVKMLADSSLYVHFAALRFLLKKNDGYAPNISEEMANLEKIKRYDMALEILSCYAQFSPDAFIDFLGKIKSKKIRTVALEVVYKKRMTTALPFVQGLVRSTLLDKNFKVTEIQDLKKVVQCLTISPLPENEDLLIELTKNTEDEVRALAFKAWLHMRPDSFATITEKMVFDPCEQIHKTALQLRQHEETQRNAA